MCRCSQVPVSSHLGAGNRLLCPCVYYFPDTKPGAWLKAHMCTHAVVTYAYLRKKAASFFQLHQRMWEYAAERRSISLSRKSSPPYCEYYQDIHVRIPGGLGYVSLLPRARAIHSRRPKVVIFASVMKIA